MSERCYTLQLSDDPADLAIVRLDVSDGEPTDDDLEALRGYLAALADAARNASDSDPDLAERTRRIRADE